MGKQRLVVIGNGMAGARAIEEVLARGGGDQFDIVMFGNERYGNYNRILLSNVLNGSQSPDDILINPLDWYAEKGIRLHLGESVDGIDRAAKVVVSQNGVREHYDKLLIATGSRAFIPPMAGAYVSEGKLKTGVFGYRTLDDCSAILDYAKRGKKIVTIGGGLLGLEAARAMMGARRGIAHRAPRRSSPGDAA
jgi:nitrite reductase (NADH) large subunit